MRKEILLEMDILLGEYGYPAKKPLAGEYTCMLLEAKRRVEGKTINSPPTSLLKKIIKFLFN